MFYNTVNKEITLIARVYVDDQVGIAKDKETFDAFCAQLNEEFPVNDTSDLSCFMYWLRVQA